MNCVECLIMLLGRISVVILLYCHCPAHVDGKLTPPLITHTAETEQSVVHHTPADSSKSWSGEELRYTFHLKYSSTLNSWFLPGIPLLSICGFRTHGSNFLPVVTQRHWERPGRSRTDTMQIWSMWGNRKLESTSYYPVVKGGEAPFC